MAITYSFGDWLQQRRKALDLTQRALAERAYCSLDMIKKIETDRRRPSRELALSLARALDLPEAQREIFVACARGLRAVDHLGQVQGGGAPAEMVVTPGIVRPALPTAATPFVGRKSELHVLERLLAESWLVTIVGPGGMGKTRLALAAAQARQRAGEPVAFISLAEVDEGNDVALAITQGLGLPLEGSLDATKQLLAALRRKRLLLVLDNLEQLRGDLALLVQMQQVAQEMTVLATSRERLGLPGEQLLPLQGLPYPRDQGELLETSEVTMTARYAAVQLFVESARRVMPDFRPYDAEAVFQLCQITEGMPLALELAGAWMDSLTLADLVHEVARHLDLAARKPAQGPARHRSIETVLDTTWMLLRDDERAALARIAIFRGGFTRAAAEAVADVDLPLLSALAGRHLLQLSQRSARYRQHELMRRYGLEKLAGMGELETMQRRHFSFYMDLAKTGDSQLRSVQQASWLARLNAEQDNLRQALTWSLSQAGRDAARLTLALCWYWRMSNNVIEARQRLAEALAQEGQDAAVRAALYFHAGHVAWMQGAYGEARQQQERSCRLWQSLGAVGRNGLAYSHHALGMIANQEGALAEAQRHLRKSLALFEQSGDAWGVAFAQQWLGATLFRMGNVEAGRRQLREGLDSARRIGDRWASGLFLSWLAWLEWERGNWQHAFAPADEARQIAEAMGHWHSLGATLQLLARIAHKQGDVARARQRYQEAIKLYEEMGNERNLAQVEAALRALDGGRETDEAKG